MCFLADGYVISWIVVLGRMDGQARGITSMRPASSETHVGQLSMPFSDSLPFAIYVFTWQKRARAVSWYFSVFGV